MGHALFSKPRGKLLPQLATERLKMSKVTQLLRNHFPQGRVEEAWGKASFLESSRAQAVCADPLAPAHGHLWTRGPGDGLAANVLASLKCWDCHGVP